MKYYERLSEAKRKLIIDDMVSNNLRYDDVMSKYKISSTTIHKLKQSPYFKDKKEAYDNLIVKKCKGIIQKSVNKIDEKMDTSEDLKISELLDIIDTLSNQVALKEGTANVNQAFNISVKVDKE